MHGIVLGELKKYVDEKVGKDAWDRVLAQAGFPKKVYYAVSSYPDQEAVALVSTASEMTGLPVSTIIEDFGEFIAPHLVALYKHLVRPEWKALDFVENTEAIIHSVVRNHNPGATPPALWTERNGPNELILTYKSGRKMCGIAKGVLRAVGKLYKENLTIEETSCMHLGSPSCNFVVRKT